MVLTPSTMQDIGTLAPEFALQDTAGEIYSLREREIDKGLLVIFMCNHCPYVKHIIEKLTDSIRYYQQKGIEVVAINSNDYKEYPDDSPEKMAQLAEQMDFSFPYLVDDTQAVARAYKAACTPDFFFMMHRNGWFIVGSMTQRGLIQQKRLPVKIWTGQFHNLFTGKE